MRFDGKVAIVTGAGAPEGLGQAYAKLLAARGAKVVVNDFGVGPDGRGVLRAHAEVVAQEIRDLGGDAVADAHDVTGQDSAKAVVKTALDTYGEPDILINNAGIVRAVEFRSASADDIMAQLSVHLLGTIWMCKAVWPHMEERGYGRIVSTSSSAAWGSRLFSIYGAAKGGILSLMRSLAIEGAPYGIKVNTISPWAVTTSFKYFNEVTETTPKAPPEAVAPVVAYLCHEDCQSSSEFVWSGEGRVKIGRLGANEVHDLGTSATVEDVSRNWDAITARTSFEEFSNLSLEGHQNAHLALKQDRPPAGEGG